MRRREFIAGIGSAAAWPVVARAQQRAMPVIGYLSGRTADTDASMLVAVRRGLGDVGHGVGDAARCERNHDLDRPRRLRPRAVAGQRDCKKSDSHNHPCQMQKSTAK
jgi:hypothetical protein